MNIVYINDDKLSRKFITMLTQQQFRLLNFIYQKTTQNGVSPSFDEMRDALELKSKSGIHRLIQALEERGYLRRIPNRARALEVVRMPQNAVAAPNQAINSHVKIKNTDANIPKNIPSWARNIVQNYTTNQTIRKTYHLSDNIDDEEISNHTKLPLYGKIAAGTPIEALHDDSAFIHVPNHLLGKGDYYCLCVEGDSMVEAGILNDDIIIIEKTENVAEGTIAVALIDNEEATLKRVFIKGDNIILKPENRHYKERELATERVRVQGRLSGLIRKYPK